MANTPEKTTDPDQTPALWDAETEALIAKSAAQVEKGLSLGIELRNLGRDVSHAQLRMRIRTPHPKTGLPDLLASGGPASGRRGRSTTGWRRRSPRMMKSASRRWTA